MRPPASVQKTGWVPFMPSSDLTSSQRSTNAPAAGSMPTVRARPPLLTGGQPLGDELVVLLPALGASPATQIMPSLAEQDEGPVTAPAAVAAVLRNAWCERHWERPPFGCKGVHGHPLALGSGRSATLAGIGNVPIRRYLHKWAIQDSNL